MAEPVRILIAEDRETDYELARREIRRAVAGAEFRRVETRAEFLEDLRGFAPELVITDYRMPSFDGLTALKLALEHAPGTPVIVLTSAMNEDTAVECMRAGAADYVIKEHTKRLGPAVVRALEEKQERGRRRELEQALVQAQKMETVGRLAGGVAHDFNNMISVMLGYAQLAQAKLPAEHPAAGDLREIERAAERARDLTRQLLAFSRKQKVEPRVLDVNRQMEELGKTIGRLVGAEIELRMKAGAGLWSVRMDALQLDQVLMNLVVNACDAMPEGGVLTIETANERRAESEFVSLKVADDGSGMSAEVLEHIFEPFFTTKEVGKGTGLGLATVYGIVQQSGGRVEVESAAGMGSEFRVLLPRWREEAEARTQVAEARQTGEGRILVVEDEPQVRMMTATMLRHLGYVVVEAESGERALELAGAGERFDLLLSDVAMPGMNGPELAGRMRALRPGVPVVLVSGYALLSGRGREGAPEGTRLLEKPFDMAGLAREVGQALREKRRGAGG